MNSQSFHSTVVEVLLEMTVQPSQNYYGAALSTGEFRYL